MERILLDYWKTKQHSKQQLQYMRYRDRGLQIKKDCFSIIQIFCKRTHKLFKSSVNQNSLKFGYLENEENLFDFVYRFKCDFIFLSKQQICEKLIDSRFNFKYNQDFIFLIQDLKTSWIIMYCLFQVKSSQVLINTLEQQKSRKYLQTRVREFIRTFGINDLKKESKQK
ncbi:unnamed protein product [Paramecium octaurelia]|uniref:Uncharacterized protein n=1 Tax=Paramecium octaurelia TaxID=43137 RepID=A0A8S1SW98_PAROT|nr:unnamed protein product [Paramecium octaurelia]